MNSIILDGRKLKAYEDLLMMCEYAGTGREYGEKLWLELLTFPALYEEYISYLTKGIFSGELSVGGYSILDLYVKQLDLDNLIHDTGKNTGDCNKIRMILEAMKMMAGLLHDPENARRIMEDDFGMDQW